MLSIIQNRTIHYPDRKYAYSPNISYPEYRFNDISPASNFVYDAIRNLFIQSDLDADRRGTSSWNPLGGYIGRNRQVFVLCNFVQDQLFHESDSDFQAKCTHGSIIRALIDYVLLAVGENGRVYFGNAPLQNTDFQAVLSQTGARVVHDYYQSKGAPVESVDLRLFVAKKNILGGINDLERRSDDEGLSINLGLDSLLADLENAEGPEFRVSFYNPERIKNFHNRPNHVYVLNRKIAESDVVISVPKLKVHEKVGVTLALKGCVGTIAHKDSLAHHRYGSPSIGGDEYPSDPFHILRLASAFHDFVYRTSSSSVFGNFLRVIDTNIWRVIRRLTPIQFGAWWGNDTAWRMALDTARITSYADLNKMQKDTVRKHLVLIDGIIGGEGQGPLRPKPVHSGMLILADNPVISDYAGSLLMGYDPMEIPLIRESLSLKKYALVSHPVPEEVAIFNGSSININDLIRCSAHTFLPPKGWVNHIEMEKNERTLFSSSS